VGWAYQDIYWVALEVPGQTYSVPFDLCFTNLSDRPF
jgi:hypothetical protein